MSEKEKIIMGIDGSLQSSGIAVINGETIPTSIPVEVTLVTAENVDKYVLRHYDVTHKKCPAQMANSANDADWVAFKKMVKNILTNGTITASTTTVVRKDDTVVKTNYQVRVTASALNIRKGPGASYATNGVITDKGVYTIVEEQKVGSTTWGKLKSGAGWISLAYTKKL